MFQDLTSLVLDIGTCKTRVGYGGDDAPKVVCSSYVARPTVMERENQKYLLGDKQLYADRTDCEIETIFQRHHNDSYLFHYEAYETLVQHLLCHELKANIADYSLLISEEIVAKPHETKEAREKISEFFFERLNLANLYFLKSPVLSCFATGRSTALVLDSGDTFTRAVSVHDGFCLTKSAKWLPKGGRTISKEIGRFIETKLNKRLGSRYDLLHHSYSASFLSYHQNQLLADIKEHLSVRRTEESMEQQSNLVEYELPDRQMITLDRKEIKHYLLTGGQGPDRDKDLGLLQAIPSLISDNINSCDVDIKKELYSNILMAGGNVLFDGLIQDTIGRVSEFAPPNAKVKSVSVCSPNERKCLAWLGGSIVTSLSSFQSYWVGNQEWKENGYAIIDKKCA